MHLNAVGPRQARELARRLQRLPLAAVYTSLLNRALETAAPLAESTGLAARIAGGLEELDYGS